MCEHTQFISYGVYCLNAISAKDMLFVCVPCSGAHVAKLVQYKHTSKGVYKKTGISYFLNGYKTDDIKSMFLRRENYEILGRIGSNYCLSEDENQLIRA